MRDRTRRLLAASLFALPCACTTQDATPSHGAPAVELGEPLVLVGADDSRDGHELFRVSGARRASDGTLYIANGGSAEVRGFSPTGDLVTSFSGQGAGPGEHQYLAEIWLAADTVVTFDAVAQKVAYWTPGGELLHELQLSDRRYELAGRFGDGTFVDQRVDRSLDFPRETSRIDSVSLAVLEPHSGRISDVARMPFQTRFSATLPDGRTIYTGLPLEPRLNLAVGHRSMVVGYGGDSTVMLYGSDGAHWSELAVPLDARPLTSDLRAAWQATMTERVSAGERPQMERYLASLPYPSTLPRFDRLLLDDAERVWVRGYRVPGEDSVTWFVLDPDGTTSLTLRTAADLELLQVADGHLVGLHPRADGVEQVGVWRLDR